VICRSQGPRLSEWSQGEPDIAKDVNVSLFPTISLTIIVTLSQHHQIRLMAIVAQDRQTEKQKDKETHTWSCQWWSVCVHQHTESCTNESRFQYKQDKLPATEPWRQSYSRHTCRQHNETITAPRPMMMMMMMKSQTECQQQQQHSEVLLGCYDQHHTLLLAYTAHTDTETVSQQSIITRLQPSAQTDTPTHSDICTDEMQRQTDRQTYRETQRQIDTHRY